MHGYGRAQQPADAEAEPGPGPAQHLRKVAPGPRHGLTPLSAASTELAPLYLRARAAPLSLRRAGLHRAASGLRQRSIHNQGGTAMPATREVLSRPERLPNGQDSAAGMQHEYAARGGAEVRPARAKPRSWSPQPKPQPGQWAVR